MWVEEGYDDFNSLVPAFDVDNEAFNSLVSDSMLFNIVFLFKHILFHLHEKGLGRAQMLCYSHLLYLIMLIHATTHSHYTFT